MKYTNPELFKVKQEEIFYNLTINDKKWVNKWIVNRGFHIIILIQPILTINLYGWFIIIPPLVIFFMMITDLNRIKRIDNDLREFHRLKEDLEKLGIQSAFELNRENIAALDVIELCQSAYIAGTILSVSLWFLYPEINRLEPLTIIYGFGVGLFGYFRIYYRIPNLLDRIINQNESNEN